MSRYPSDTWTTTTRTANANELRAAQHALVQGWKDTDFKRRPESVIDYLWHRWTAVAPRANQRTHYRSKKRDPMNKRVLRREPHDEQPALWVIVNLNIYGYDDNLTSQHWHYLDPHARKTLIEQCIDTALYGTSPLDLAEQLDKNPHPRIDGPSASTLAQVEDPAMDEVWRNLANGTLAHLIKCTTMMNRDYPKAYLGPYPPSPDQPAHGKQPDWSQHPGTRTRWAVRFNPHPYVLPEDVGRILTIGHGPPAEDTAYDYEDKWGATPLTCEATITLTETTTEWVPVTSS